ncbi:hypothetical protein SeMB42_g03090 [Synchytrium endobioticum]|uniref:Uncharacterized protein n=1 Tax=Synchytrium endobioticum TaxID=286115 RepID=A0A507DA26_9FUNG|nr:hypothetical protein SeLEV6574_g06388 [Synchytrium endobioticum]TPX48237.1 hypothetical protein SeMB42_g03090 [Synchytrium endobioticum]
MMDMNRVFYLIELIFLVNQVYAIAIPDQSISKRGLFRTKSRSECKSVTWNFFGIRITLPLGGCDGPVAPADNDAGAAIRSEAPRESTPTPASIKSLPCTTRPLPSSALSPDINISAIPVATPTSIINGKDTASPDISSSLPRPSSVRQSHGQTQAASAQTPVKPPPSTVPMVPSADAIGANDPPRLPAKEARNVANVTRIAATSTSTAAKSGLSPVAIAANDPPRPPAKKAKGEVNVTQATATSTSSAAKSELSPVAIAANDPPYPLAKKAKRRVDATPAGTASESDRSDKKEVNKAVDAGKGKKRWWKELFPKSK